MKKIPKEIVDKIEQRNMLTEEIKVWCEDNLDMDGKDSCFAKITDHHIGNEQGTKSRKEWCDQHCIFEDFYAGKYYWETAYKNKFLCMEFEV